MQTDHIAKDVQRDLRKRQSASESGELPDAIGGAIEQEVRCSMDAKKELKLKKKQFIREVKCSVNLAEMLDRYAVQRDETGFMTMISQEAHKLVRTAFGGRMLRTIGCVYESAAETYLAGLRGNFTFETQLAQWRESAHSATVRITAMSSVAKSAYAVKQMHEAVEAASKSQEAADDTQKKQEIEQLTRNSIEESLPMFLQAIWDVSAVDIENTVSHVCNKVLKDISVPWQLRLRRAHALLRLGRVFRDVGQVEHSDFSQSQVAKQHLEEALYGSIKEKP